MFKSDDVHKSDVISLMAFNEHYHAGKVVYPCCDTLEISSRAVIITLRVELFRTFNKL